MVVKEAPNISRFVFIFFCLLLFFHVLFTFCGFYGNDDAIYTRDAATLVHTGRLNSEDHYSLRWITIIITAFFYKLFGVNAVSSALFSFASFVTSGIIIYKIIEREAVLIQLLAFVLFFLNYTVIFYSHRLLPDAGVGLFVLLAYYCYHRERFISSSPLKHALFFSASVFLAALTKETIFITLPLWIFLFISDIVRKRNYFFWTSAVISLLILAFSYAVYFKITKGDWLYRYHLLQQLNASYGDGTGASSFTGTMQRIGYMLWQSFLLNGDMEYLIPAIVGIFYFRSVFKEDRIKHVALSFLILLLSADIMTFSPTMYAPLLPDPRHFIFLIPFSVITAAFMIRSYVQQPSKYFLLLIAFFVADVFLYFSNIGNTKYIYYLIALLLMLIWFNEVLKRRRETNIFYFLLAAIMFANYMYDFLFPQYPFYFDQKEIVQHYLDTSSSAIVFTGDPQTARMGDYFLAFQNKNLKFENLATANNLNNNSKNYLLVNGDYDPYFKIKTDSVLENAGADFTQIKKVNNSVLYEVKNVQALNILKQFSTKNY
jgi:hypothetical protein